MKKRNELEYNIEKLYEEIECGLYDRKVCMQKIKALHSGILENFDQGSDNYIHLACLLMDCKDLASEISI